MAKYDFRSPRLYVDADLAASRDVVLGRDQAHYLKNVLRLGERAEVLAFNGRDGEWRCEVIDSGKRGASLWPVTQARKQPATSGPVYAFAPIKHARLDYMIQKAVEMGVSRLSPVFTQHTQVNRMNAERMRANAIEAAEQCGVLALPEIDEPRAFANWLGALPPDSVLVFCDEESDSRDAVELLKGAPEGKMTVLIGPEGGFSVEEREALNRRKNVIALSLGPRILRADTAAVAALALVQAIRGDWR